MFEHLPGDFEAALVINSDRAMASATRAKFLAAMQTLRVLQAPSPDRRVLVIGDEARPVPIPIVRAGDRWRSATEQGGDEIVNRRIGGNERNALYVLRAYIVAQRAALSPSADVNLRTEHVAACPRLHVAACRPPTRGTMDAMDEVRHRDERGAMA